MKTELVFQLDVDDGWPPVAKECLRCVDVECGYQIQEPPLFIKDLSVGDVIEVVWGEEGEVVAWSHVEKSKRSIVWIMVSGDYSVASEIECLKRLRCNVAEFEAYRYFAVDVPAECPVERLDECLDALSREEVSVVFPSFRH